MKQIAILGSTGSIGRQTLAVVEAMPERFGVVSLAAGNNIEELAQQILRHRPELVSVATSTAAADLAERLRAAGIAKLPEILHGSAGMLAVATHPHAATVVSAAVGVVGLEATYAAVKAGKQVALSNKEVLVAAGEIVMAAARQANVELLPVDSEHNAIHQCLRAGQHREVKKHHPDRIRRPFSEDAPRRNGRSHARTSSRASQLAHGPPHHHRFGNAGQQRL